MIYFIKSSHALKERKTLYIASLKKKITFDTIQN